MNRIATIAVVPMVLVLFACGGKLNGVVDFDHERSFVSIQKVGFYEDVKPHERAQTETRNKVRAEIKRQLEAKGLTVGDAAAAELQIIYHVGNHSKIRVGAGERGAGVTATLAIEFLDPVIGRSVWYGTVEQTWKEGLDLDERIETAVRVLLERFPPETTRPSKLLRTNQGEERQAE